MNITTTPRSFLRDMYFFDKCARIHKMLPRTVVALHLLQRPVSVDPVLCLNGGHDQRHRPYLSRRRFRSWPLQPPVELAGNGYDLFCMGALCVHWFIGMVDSRCVNFHCMKKGTCCQVGGKHFIFCSFFFADAFDILIEVDQLMSSLRLPSWI